MKPFRPKPQIPHAPEYEEISPTGRRMGPESEAGLRGSNVTGAGRPVHAASAAAAAGGRGPAGPPMCWRVVRVARHLDVSKKRVYQLVEEGRLEAVRIGPRGMRILVGSLERYLEGLRRRDGRFRG